MPRNRFVSADVTRIEISDGDWIELKTDLNTGDQKKLENAGLLPPVMIDGKLINPIDWTIYELLRAEIFLKDWSFRGPDDKPVPLSMDAIRNLDPETFTEISTAIFEHVTKRSDQKKLARNTLKASSFQTST